MSVQIKDAKMLHEYASKVMGRIVHHAPNVMELFPALLGYIWTYADPGSVYVRGQEGDTKNMGWAEFGGRRYAFRYAHQAGGYIEIRDGGLKGAVVATGLTNFTPNAQLLSIFKKL